MGKTTVEQQFGVALRLLNACCRRGFQAQIVRATRIDAANLNSMMKTGKGAQEQTRRDVLRAAVDVALQERVLENPMTYDHCLLLGQVILERFPNEEELDRIIPKRYASVDASNPEIQSLFIAARERFVATAEQSSGQSLALPSPISRRNAVAQAKGGDERLEFDQTMQVMFRRVCDWWAEEHSEEGYRPTDFFDFLDERMPEYVEWRQRKRDIKNPEERWIEPMKV